MQREICHRITDEKLSKATYDRMVRLSARQVHADRKNRTDRQKRLDPIYRELESAFRNSSEMAKVVKAIDLLNKPTKPPLLKTGRNSGRKRGRGPNRSILRAGSITNKFPPPYIGSVWTDETGGGNSWGGPTANGDTGEMAFDLHPGQDRAGSMACWVAVGVQVDVPQGSYSRIYFSVTTSLNWSYWEMSNWWRETKGDLWIGQYADLYDENGAFVENALATQVTLASWDDRNLAGSGRGNDSQNPVMKPPLQVSVPVAGSWDGGMIDYRCWIGGSALADGSNNQSACGLAMDNAVCRELEVDIFF